MFWHALHEWKSSIRPKKTTKIMVLYLVDEDNYTDLKRFIPTNMLPLDGMRFQDTEELFGSHSGTYGNLLSLQGFEPLESSVQ